MNERLSSRTPLCLPRKLDFASSVILSKWKCKKGKFALRAEEEMTTYYFAALQVSLESALIF